MLKTIRNIQNHKEY